MAARWISLVCAFILVPCDAQTDSTSSEASEDLIRTTLAMYILIGIAGLYFAISILCFCLILCACYYNCKRSRPQKPDEIPLSPMEHKPPVSQEVAGSVRRKQYEYQTLEESPTTITILDIEKTPSMKRQTPRFLRNQLEGEKTAMPISPLCGSPSSSPRPQTAGSDLTSQLVEDAIVPSTTFPSGVPPIALAPVHKTPNLRFLHRQPATPTLTSRGSPRVGAKDSPPLASNSTPALAPVHKTPNLRQASSRFSHRQPGTPTVKPRVSAKDSPSLTSSSATALAPVHKTPNLRRTSPRFSHRQPGTPTLRDSPRVSAKDPLPLDSSFTTALTTEHMTPNLRWSSPRIAKWQPGTPTLSNPRDFPRVSTKGLPSLVSSSTSGAVNPGYHREELITPLTLKQELSTISHKWFEIGTYFKVQPNTLKTIRQTSESNTEVCLMKLCKEWVEEERDATWSMVVHMLESETISELALANSIKKKYCNSSQSPDGSPDSLKRSWI